jgi:hypothetical protein
MQRACELAVTYFTTVTFRTVAIFVTDIFQRIFRTQRLRIFLSIYLHHCVCLWAGIAQSVLRLATGWTVRGSNTGRGGFSAPVQTGPVAHPASYTMGAESLPGVKRPGRVVDHPPPSSAEVKERVELYLFSPSGPSWPVLS